jgi:hypothetical protein
MEQEHEFLVGASVTFRAPSLATPSGAYKVIRQMPQGRDGIFQYRIKSAAGLAELMVREFEIQPLP